LLSGANAVPRDAETRSVDSPRRGGGGTAQRRNKKPKGAWGEFKKAERTTSHGPRAAVAGISAWGGDPPRYTVAHDPEFTISMPKSGRIEFFFSFFDSSKRKRKPHTGPRGVRIEDGSNSGVRNNRARPATVISPGLKVKHRRDMGMQLVAFGRFRDAFTICNGIVGRRGPPA